MKRFFVCILIVLLAYSVFAEKKITVLQIGDIKFANGHTMWGDAIAKLKVVYPDVIVEFVSVDQTGGTTMTMDAMLAAGSAPNIYYDSQVRTGKYLVKEYALPLNKLVSDINKYDPAAIAPFTKKGDVLGLPMPGSSQGMFINLDIMKEIGYTVPVDWTISDFLKMAELVKQKYNGKKYATGFFAASQSGDYLINNWFASFGVPFYENGNYDKPVMADKGGVKVYEFYQLLMKNGYIYKDSANIQDDDFILQWCAGNIAATAFFPAWIKAYLDSAIAQGTITKYPNYTFVAFPRAPGVTKVPTYTNGCGVVIHKTGTDLDIISAKLVEFLGDAESQGNQAKYQNNAPIRSDATYFTTDPYLKMIDGIIAKNGVMDVGVSDPRFPERRAIQYPILQKLLAFKITPEDAIKEYQKKMSEVK